MLKENQKVITNFQRFIDLSITVISFYLAYIIRFTFFPSEYSIGQLTNIELLAIPIAIIWWITSNKIQLYQSQRFHAFLGMIYRVVKAVIIANVFLLAAITMLHLPDPGRLLLIFFAGINVVLLVLGRIFTYEMMNYFRKKGYNTRKILVVGTGNQTKELIDLIKDHTGWGIIIEGIIATGKLNNLHDPKNEDKVLFKGYPILGNVKDLPEILNEHVVDLVFFMVKPGYLNDVQPYIVYCLQFGVGVKVSANIFNKLNFIRPMMDEIGTVPLFSFEMVKHSPYSIMFKEILDSLIAAFSLILASPLFLLIAIAIRIDSKGPVLFKQVRIGLHGREFNLYKFRSMVIDAEERKAGLLAQNEQDGPVFKIKEDPRVTKIGKFLRRTSLDELPQLLNVLIGDMSLVGPRPPLPDEVSQYEPWQRRRLSVKPGITCSWQVSGRNDVDFETWMKMDMNYIDEWSLSEDAKLLFKTIPAVILQKGVK